MSKKRNHIHIHPFAGRLTRWLLFSLLTTLGCVATLVYWVTSTLAVEIEANRNLGLLDINNERINTVLTTIETGAANNHVDIEENIHNEEGLKEAMRWLLQLNPHAIGVGVAFIDNYFPEKGRWHELYASRDSTGINIEQIGSEHHDYLHAEWFTTCLKKKKGCWSDAYYDDAGAHDILCTYALPIHDAKGRIVGVMGTDVSTNWLQDQLKEMDEKNYENSFWKYKSTDDRKEDKNEREWLYSYSFIVQRDGTYLVHPQEERIMKENLFKEVMDTKDSIDNKLIDKIKKGERGYIDNGDIIEITIDEQSSYVFYAPIEHTGWSTVIVVPAMAINLLGYIFGGLVVAVMTIGIIIVLTSSYVIVRHTTKPLKRLAAFAGEVAQGHFDTPLPTIKKHDEIWLLRMSFEGMQKSLAEYIERLKKTTALKASIDSELRIAHSIQMAMLPKDFPPYPERHDIDIYGELSPAKAVGGDLFDFYLHDEQLFFCVGDVSGKGVPASMVMAVICSMFRYISGHTSSPDQIVSDLNNAISEKNEASMFVTLFVGVLDLKSGLMRYSNAGHDAPMLIGRNVGLLPCDPNLPVGVMPGWKFTLQEAVIDRNTTIFLYTDGLNEAEDNLHAQFGKERVQAVAETLLAQKRHQPKTLIASMSDAVQEFVGDAEQSDDLTMLAIQLKDKM